MDQLVAGRLEIGAAAHDDATLKTALADLAERFEFTGYGFAKRLTGDFYVISNLSPDWLKRSRKFDVERPHHLFQ